MLLILTCEYQPYSQGKVLYDFHCANCHMQDGSGLRGLIPPLANADYLKNYQEDLACIMRYGLKGEILVNGKKYDTEMAGIPTLNDVQINNIINYINHAWGNDLGVSNVQKVKTSLESCSLDPINN